MDQLLPGQSDTISIPSLASLEGDMIALLSSGDDSFLEDADLDPKIECSINLPYSVIEDTVKSTFDDKLGRCSNTADVLWNTRIQAIPRVDERVHTVVRTPLMVCTLTNYYS